MSNLLHEAHQRLLTDEAALARLAELRGWTVEAIKALGVGLDNGRVVIPVMDEKLAVQGVLRYQPNRQLDDGTAKMMSAPGTPRELFPPPEAVDDATVWLVEGEPDAISATSIGLPAVGIPGASSWRAEWAARFAGKDVIVCCDSDAPGRGLAARAADDLIEHARTVRIVDLAPARDDGYDVGEMVASADGPHEHPQVRELLERVAADAPSHLRREDRPPKPRLSVIDWRRAVTDYLYRRTGGPTWPIPFETLREATDGGMRPGELWVVAGYSSHGKSLYLDALLDEAADAGARCHLYMTEMTLVQRGLRAVSRRSGTISMTRLRRQQLSPTELSIAEETLAKLPYAASIVNSWTPRQVATDIIASRTQVAVVDLLHGWHYDNERELSRFVHEFADAATSDAAGLDGGCTVVLACHLNDSQMRDRAGSAKPRPGMHSLKGATAIKQRADLVMFTWFEDDDDGRPGTEGEIWIAKGRNGGATGEQKVRLDTTTLTLKERWL
jgi:DnaB helicase-like protein/Toprim domain-containing protein